MFRNFNSSRATPSYSYSPQPYYVTHPTSVIDHDEDYQGEIQRDAQEDKLITAMMLLARAITQHYSTPTNNRDGMVHQMEANDQTIQRASQTESNLRKPNLNASVIMMARIQPIDDTSATSSRFDANILIKNTIDDDQIDSSIIFDDPYMEDNGGENKHDSITHDQYVALGSLMDNAQNEA
ncbi:hypothetical protein Tco_1244653 [Tanacetum coccineum]